MTWRVSKSWPTATYNGFASSWLDLGVCVTCDLLINKLWGQCDLSLLILINFCCGVICDYWLIDHRACVFYDNWLIELRVVTGLWDLTLGLEWRVNTALTIRVQNIAGWGWPDALHSNLESFDVYYILKLWSFN